jgi:hypothetical protein
MSEINLFRTDPAAWAEKHFYVDRRWTGKQWTMKPGPIVLADYQRDVLREALSGKYGVVVWSEPGKSGKSTIAALANVWTALHKERSETYVVANDLKGTGRVYKAIEYCVSKNPHLKPRSIKNEIQWRDGITQAVPADYRGESGSDPSIVCFDECEHFMYSHQDRLVAEFKVSPTRDFSLQWFTGYGGWMGESDLWQKLLERRENGKPVLEHIRNSDGQPACFDCGSTLVFYSNVLRQPWQTEKWVKTQQDNLTPGDYKRIILNEFVPISESAFVQPEWWQGCYDPLVRPIKAGDKTPIVLALDLAMGAVGGDHLALVGVTGWGRDGDLAVKYAKSWEPTDGRFDYDTTVKPALNWLLNNCHVLCLVYDPYQAIELMNQFKGRVWCREFSQQSERDKSDRHLYDLITSGRLHHYNDETLNNHILASGQNTKGENKLRLVKAGRRKIDLAVSLSMAAYQASQLNLPGDPAGVVETFEQQIDNGQSEPADIDNGILEVSYRGVKLGVFTIETINGPAQVGRNRADTFRVSHRKFKELQKAEPGGHADYPGWVCRNS